MPRINQYSYTLDWTDLRPRNREQEYRDIIFGMDINYCLENIGHNNLLYCPCGHKVTTERGLLSHTMIVFDLYNHDVLYVAEASCGNCGLNSFPVNSLNKRVYTNERRTGFFMSGYAQQMTSVNVCVQTLDEQEEFFKNEKDIITGEKLNPGNIHYYFVSEKTVRPANNHYVKRRVYFSDTRTATLCNRCRKPQQKDEPLSTYYSPEGDELKCCEDCKNDIDDRFFGFKMKFLSGRSKKYNPFDRYIGLELETVGGKDFNYFGVPKELTGMFKSIYDGSIYESNLHGEEDDDNSPVNSRNYEQDGDHEQRGNGREFVTIPLSRDKFVTNTKELCAFLKSQGCSVNKSCGFHIHFDMRKETMETIRKTYAVYSLFEEQLFGMLPRSRRKSRYCLPLKKEYKQLFERPFDSFWYGNTNPRHLENMKKEKYQSSRYSSINYHALFFHGTLENRQHSGTLNPDKIIKWAMLNLILIEYAKENKMSDLIKLSGTTKALYGIVKEYEKRYPQLVRYDLCEYIANRMMKFSNGKQDNNAKIVRDLKPTIAENIRAGIRFGDMFGQ